MSPEILDMAVKLASAGSSGICVLAILWTGYLLKTLPIDAPKQMHHTVRLYMGMCTFIAVLSAATGLWNAQANATKIANLTQEHKVEVADLTEARNTALEKSQNLAKEVERYATRFAEAKKGVDQLLDIKLGVVANLNPDDPNVKILKQVDKNLKEVIE